MSTSFTSSIEHAKTLMALPECIAISFEVFDTLLIRPGLLPLDVLLFMRPTAREIVPDPDFDFIAARGAAADIVREALARTGCGEIPLADIYDSLAAAYDLSKAQKEALMAAELEIELSLLKRNECVAALFDQARQCGKKTLIISDTYLPREVVTRALKANGLGDFSQLYVSSEIKLRKDTGGLFSHVLMNEQLRAGQLLHIGGDPVADFHVPRDLGIAACLLPKALDILREASAPTARVYRAMIDASLESRLILGLAVKRLLADHLLTLDGNSLFRESPFVLGYVGIGPFLTGIIHAILQNEVVSNTYVKIHFASRDGFLPLQAYREMAALWPKALDADYLYCGRRAYDIYKFDGSCIRYLTEDTERVQEEGYSVRNLLDALISTDFCKEVAGLPSSVLDGNLQRNIGALTDFLQQNQNRIAAILRAKREAACAYYGDKIARNESGRAIVFDLGYSGSVSSATSRLGACVVDKIYVWQTDKNIERDKLDGTVTYVLLPDPKKLETGIPRGNLICEEGFSSLETSCIGFAHTDSGVVPLFDREEQVPEAMRRSLLEIQRGAMTFVRDVIANLGAFLPALAFSDIEECLIPLHYSIDGGGSKDMGIFASIVFDDKFFQSKTKSLYDKLVEAADRQKRMALPLAQSVESEGAVMTSPFVDRSHDTLVSLKQELARRFFAFTKLYRCLKRWRRR